MNAGLANLATLKAWLLPASMLAGSDYDDQIAAVGQGIAAQLQRRCNRLWARTVDDTFEVEANRLHVVLPRYPLEAAPTIEVRDDLSGGYVAQTYNDLVIDHNLNAGLIRFGSWAGSSTSRLRFTYTGGYWWEQLEPDHEDYPTSQPTGSFAVPEDLLLGWRLQCEHVWQQRDKLGLAVSEKPTATPALAQIRIIPAVAELIVPFIRHTLT